MKKCSVPTTNDLCPQSLYVYGTKKADGKPNFGLFCWFSFCCMEDLSVMCAIGDDKETLRNIRRNGVFSANLVTEKLLPLADYFGTADGRDADKMDVPVAIESGAVLDVPVLSDSPISFELEVAQEIKLNDRNSTLFICRIRNTLKDEALMDPAMTSQERLRRCDPVYTCMNMEYWRWDGRFLGRWHEPAQSVKPGTAVGMSAQGI